MVIQELPGLSFPCAFCGRAAGSGSVYDDPFVTHEQPACGTFLQLDPEEFVCACAAHMLMQHALGAPPKATPPTNRRT